jgi:hypothetical protein
MVSYDFLWFLMIFLWSSYDLLMVSYGLFTIFLREFLLTDIFLRTPNHKPATMARV